MVDAIILLTYEDADPWEEPRFASVGVWPIPSKGWVSRATWKTLWVTRTAPGTSLSQSFVMQQYLITCMVIKIHTSLTFALLDQAGGLQ